MKILHTADWHIGELNGPTIDGKNARLLDTLDCADFLVEYAQKQKPDAILISGDIFDKSKLWGDNMLSLINEVAMRLRKLADVAPTVLLFGTDNHESLRAFENIRSMCIYGLSIITTPDMFLVNTKSGLLQVAGVPGFDKGYFRAKYPGMIPAEENQMCSQFLGDIVNGLSSQLSPSTPSVLMAHYTVVGCELDNGQHVFSQSEVVLPKEVLIGSSFDLVCLGHIHRAQQVDCSGKPVFYSGAINGITFNEEGQDKGFWMHEIYSDLPYDNVNSTFIKTPSRDFYTMEVDLTESIDLPADLKWKLAGIGDGPGNTLLMFPTVGKIVRLEYECTEEQRPQLNHKEMESLLKSGGAFHVAEIKAKRIITALSKQELSETSGPLENLASWLTSEEFSAEEITRIIDLAKPLIATISAKMPTGTLNGMFVPKSLKVKNYRYYIEESFNFLDVYFATVNGPNGIGKSSFFMDAIRDCVYEEPRTGITGSWITNGQMDGMIDFVFGMGETDWRIIRTRSIKGSGKTTLALQEYLTDKWEDRSGTTVKATQEKIEALLGMDCDTFSCTALIMQDAYGLFMEADKEQRMGVLANILGLNIYEQMTDLTKTKVTELNKQLTISKVKLADLNEKLKAKPELEESLKANQQDLEQVIKSINLTEERLKEAEESIRYLQAKSEKIPKLEAEIKTLTDEITIKQSDLEEKKRQSERASKILENEQQILTKSEEYLRVKDQVLVLETKQPKLQELSRSHTKTTGDMELVDNQINKLNPQINELKKVLANKAELDLAATQHKKELVNLEAMEILAEKEAALHRQIMSAEKDLDKNSDEYSAKQTSLITLRQKAAMLDNSGCIDSTNAKCAFLADAQDAKAKIIDIEAEIEAIKQAGIPLLKAIEGLNAQYTALNYDGTAHYQLRQLVNTLRPQAELASQLDLKTEILGNLKEQLTSSEKRKNELQMQLKEIDESRTILNKELKVLPALSERLPKLELWHKSKEELPAARQLVSSIADITKGIEADIKADQDKISNIKAEIFIINKDLEELPRAILNAKNIKEGLACLKTRQAEFHTKIGALTAQLEALTKDDDERKQLLSDMEPTAKELARYQVLVKAFGLDGIPFSIVRSVVPELSYMANDILGQMTGGKMALEMSTERIQKNKKEVNALEVWITDYRGRIPYGDRSGGEKVKAALANAFALADLKARRVGIMLGMMFIDEPPFLDSTGTEAYCDALEQLNYRNPQMRVIAISHDPAMKARFPQQIEVIDMSEDGSKVKLAC